MTGLLLLQVVAGMNYVFILEVVQRAQSVKQTYEVRLYGKLPQLNPACCAT